MPTTSKTTNGTTPKVKRYLVRVAYRDEVRDFAETDDIAVALSYATSQLQQPSVAYAHIVDQVENLTLYCEPI